jgi:hypothetical protein
MRLMLKRLTHTGSTLRARAVADKAAIAQAVEKNVLPLLASGRRQAADRFDLSAYASKRRPRPHGKR